MNSKFDRFEKKNISSNVLNQVIATFVVLVFIVFGTFASVMTDAVLSKNEFHSNNNQSVIINDDIRKDDENMDMVDSSEIVINSINDLTTDNKKINRRDNLNSYGQEIYDGLYRAALNCSVYKFTEQSSSSERGEILSDVFSDMLSGFILMDHPEIFWCHGSISLESTSIGGVTEYLVTMLYDCDESSIDKYNDEIKNKLKEIVKQVPKGSHYEQALWVHDYIVNNTVYTKNPVWATGSNKELGGSIYGLLIKNESVCNGYAKTFKYLMDMLEIPCTVISGICDNGELHAWNIIELDGECYQVDVTWDDPVGGDQVLLHDYFCITDEEIYNSRKADSFVSAPQCNANRY